MKAKRRQQRTPLLNRHVQFKLAMFLQEYPPSEFNRRFRDVILDYLQKNHSWRIDIEPTINGMWDLLRVLDIAEDYWQSRDTNDILEQYNPSGKWMPWKKNRE